MYSNGFSWVLKGLYLSLRILMCPYGFLKIFIRPVGFLWVLMCLFASIWVLMGSVGL